MSGTKTLKVEITGVATGAKKAFDELDSAASKSTTTVKKTEGAFGSLGSTLRNVGGFLALGAGLKTAVDEAQESIKVGAQTTAVLRSTGGAANVSAAQVGNLANSLSLKVGIDDEVIQSGENVILTFRNIRNEAGAGNDIFTQATKTALDMSVALGTDLQSASILVGKALNDPIKGLTALTRVGVSFTAQQKDQIKAMVASGDQLGAQKVILQELTSEFGGSAEAQATSLDKAKVAVKNFAEAVGLKLMPFVNAGAKALSGLTAVFQSMPSWLQTTTAAVVLGGGAWLLWGDKISGAVKSTIDFGKAVINLPAKLIEMATASIPVIATNDLIATSELGVGAAAETAAVGVGVLEAATGVGLVLAGVAAIAMLHGFSGAGGEAGSAASDLASKMDGLSDSMAQSFLVGQLHDDFVNNSHDFRDSLSQMGIGVDEFASVVAKGQDAGHAWIEMLAQQAVANGTFFQSTNSIATLRYEIDKLTGAQSQHKQRTDAANQADKAGVQVSGELANALGDVGSAGEDASQSISNLSSAITGYFNQALAGQQAVDKLAGDFSDLAQKTKDASANGLNLATVWTAQSAAARDYRGSMDSVLNDSAAIINTYVQQGVTGSALRAVIDQQRISMINQAHAAGLSDGAIAGLTQRYDGLLKQPDIHKAITVDDHASAALGKVSSLWSALQSQNNSIIFHTLLQGAPGHASGGHLDEGLNIINENGPELLQKSGSSVKVYTAGQTRSMLAPTGASGQMVQVIVNVDMSGSINGSEHVQAAVASSVRAGVREMIPEISSRIGRRELALS